MYNTYKLQKQNHKANVKKKSFLNSQNEERKERKRKYFSRWFDLFITIIIITHESSHNNT